MQRRLHGRWLMSEMRDGAGILPEFAAQTRIRRFPATKWRILPYHICHSATQLNGDRGEFYAGVSRRCCPQNII